MVTRTVQLLEIRLVMTEELVLDIHTQVQEVTVCLNQGANSLSMRRPRARVACPTNALQRTDVPHFESQHACGHLVLSR